MPDRHSPHNPLHGFRCFRGEALEKMKRPRQLGTATAFPWIEPEIRLRTGSFTARLMRIGHVASTGFSMDPDQRKLLGASDGMRNQVANCVSGRSAAAARRLQSICWEVAQSASPHQPTRSTGPVGPRAPWRWIVSDTRSRPDGRRSPSRAASRTTRFSASKWRFEPPVRSSPCCCHSCGKGSSCRCGP
jgi:hypothetical protein